MSCDGGDSLATHEHAPAETHTTEAPVAESPHEGGVRGEGTTPNATDHTTEAPVAAPQAETHAPQTDIEKAQEQAKGVEGHGAVYNPTENETPHPGNVPDNTEEDPNGRGRGMGLP